MNPELPLLKRTALFNGATEDGMRGYEQVRDICSKAYKHFGHDNELMESRCNDLIERVNTRIGSNFEAFWEVGWPKFKTFISKEFPEPPEGFTSADDFFNSYLTYLGQDDIDPSEEELMELALQEIGRAHV